MHFAKLARTTGLFLVSGVALGWQRDGFAVGDRWGMSLDVDIGALFHFAQRDFQVQLTEAHQDCFVEAGAVFDMQAGIFGSEFVQGIGKFLFIAMLAGFQRQPLQGSR